MGFSLLRVLCPQTPLRFAKGVQSGTEDIAHSLRSSNDRVQDPVISSGARNPWDDSHTNPSMDLRPSTSRSVSHHLANCFRDFSPPLGVRNDTSGNDLFLPVTSSEPFLKNHTLRYGGCGLKFRGVYTDERSPELSFCSLCIWNSLRSFCDLHPHLTADR
jgi:hypothetical protein